RTLERLWLEHRSGDHSAEQRRLPLARRSTCILPAPGHQRRKRILVSSIRYTQMLENLANAPSVRLRMLVELCQVQRSHDCSNSLARFNCLGAQLLVEFALWYSHTQKLSFKRGSREPTIDPYRVYEPRS